MEPVIIPDSIPVLGRGKHLNPSEGACAMEFLSILRGEEFSDFPSCTEPAVAIAVQYVNDGLPPDRRAAVLVEYLPQVMAAAPLPGGPIQALGSRANAKVRSLFFRFPDVPDVDFYPSMSEEEKAEQEKDLRAYLDAVLARYDKLSPDPRIAQAEQRAEVAR